MKRLVCIVEGQGEVSAIPNLCMRILIHFGISDWLVDEYPVRFPRSRLVDERVASPRRRAHQEGLEAAVAVARKRQPDAILVLVDADDDCPATWGPDAAGLALAILPAAAVMAEREYETWLLMGFSPQQLADAGLPEDVFRRRDAKKSLAKLVPGYKPITHQLRLTRGLDVAVLRERSKSFDKLVRSIRSLAVASVPPA